MSDALFSNYFEDLFKTVEPFSARRSLSTKRERRVSALGAQLSPISSVGRSVCPESVFWQNG